ncbi:hypothetical protein GCM10010435_49800 [Winogradskya consettensis]|uniref:Nudix hydrolase domain-containing protein n=1 Tax=Winogradskya consettensis TaxID=113560 RepID=A0A919SZI5_9ACTN|nr:NUDIX domain-containing protein [Actinoplanes consettensis]GIM80063.1 hypothetical protein Aco04nite_68710 [Actinoplanes consettensis]
MTIARVQAASYITRTTPAGTELLVFSYPAPAHSSTHLPAGGVEAGERPDAAAVREAVEETGIAGKLELRGIVGLQQGTYNTGLPRISLYFHFVTDEPRDAWTHTMIGDDDAWDTGLEVGCRFIALEAAGAALRTGWHGQDEFLGLLGESFGASTGG